MPRCALRGRWPRIQRAHHHPYLRIVKRRHRAAACYRATSRARINRGASTAATRRAKTDNISNINAVAVPLFARARYASHSLTRARIARRDNNAA